MGTPKSGFSDSNDIVSNNSNGSSIYCAAAAATTAVPGPETLTSTSPPDSFRLLSDNLNSIFRSPGPDFFADAKIALGEGRELPVHRCILAARSPFFKAAFSGKDRGVKLELREIAKDMEIGPESMLAVLGYLYSGKVKPLPEGVCECIDDLCSHVSCRPAIDFLVQVLYASSVFHLSELVDLYQKHLVDILDKIAVDDILVVLSAANICGTSCERLLSQCIEIIVRSDVDIVTLEKSSPPHIFKRITDRRTELGLTKPEHANFPNKHVKRIYRALDSDDVELVHMLLKEAHTTLDDAWALHYAVAFCDTKTTSELLDLGITDVNSRNPRGYTVLHIAAMRREPSVIVSLLIKGARPSDLTRDGRKALQISKRLTRKADYFKATEEGKASPRDRLCVEILEQAERRDPLLGEASLSLAMAGDDLRKRLLYLENRVGLAKLLFPMEAKVAMDIAQVDGTSEFPLLNITSRNLSNTQGTDVDLNEAPFKIQEEHLSRMRALSRTVELGKRFFPRCSAVINKIMDKGGISELTYVGNETPEEQLKKKQKCMELQEAVSKAFSEDKEESDRSSSMLSSSSLASMALVNPNFDKFAALKNSNENER
ncbi:hypothetical protein SAY87_019048 [Trapa incisa]|uniref:Uncharacterized protein n=1 Tax=Trapa incisa TaxID=236973 RepID=A0AAN7K447_9MYRT|nr:hypothetical protein SAY87_019048 [Trapa incisa]